MPAILLLGRPLFEDGERALHAGIAFISMVPSDRNSTSLTLFPTHETNVLGSSSFRQTNTKPTKNAAQQLPTNPFQTSLVSYKAIRQWTAWSKQGPTTNAAEKLPTT